MEDGRWRMEDGRWKMDSPFPFPFSPFHCGDGAVGYRFAILRSWGLGGAQPGCLSPDGADSHLHSNSDGHAPTVANFAGADRGAADVHEHARPGTIGHAPTVANLAGTDGETADAHEHARPGTIGHAPTVANLAGTDGEAAYADEYARPGAIGHASTVANFVRTVRTDGGIAGAHSHDTVYLPHFHRHTHEHDQPNGHRQRRTDVLANSHAFTQAHHDRGAPCCTARYSASTHTNANAPGG